MEAVRLRALRRFLLLFVVLVAVLALGIQLALAGVLPVRYLGAILLLLIVAFLAGSSLILRAAARATRTHLAGETPAAAPHSQQPHAVHVIRSSVRRGRPLH